jgi:hypothetical protein
VDIDLTYLPVEPRNITLTNLTAALERITVDITQTLPNVTVTKHFTARDKRLTKLFVKREEVQITVEPNEVLRGSVFPIKKADLCHKAKTDFERDVLDITLLSMADIYAGKICAALDRQHPRDLFDVTLLFQHEGITKEIRQAFVIYLASGPRPMNELLNPNLTDLKPTFDQEFSGMTFYEISLSELIATRDQLISEINNCLTQQERLFLLSLKQGEPHWDLLNLPGVEKLPALQWKIMNIRKMEQTKRNIAIGKLKAILDI